MMVDENEKFDVYIAGPIAGHDRLNIAKFRAMEAYLELQYAISAVIPHDIEPYAHEGGCPENFRRNPESDHSDCCYARNDLVFMLRNCTSIVILPGWNASNGTRLELLTGAQCGMPSLFISKIQMAEIQHCAGQLNRRILDIPDEMWSTIYEARGSH